MGPDGNQIAYRGDSAAVDFLGRTLVEGGDVPALLTVALDRAPLLAFRERFPAHLDADAFTLES